MLLGYKFFTAVGIILTVLVFYNAGHRHNETSGIRTFQLDNGQHEVAIGFYISPLLFYIDIHALVSYYNYVFPFCINCFAT